MRWAYYNEIEPYAAQWIRNLIAKGLVCDGEVDGRSVVDVRPDDLRGFRQCHFFAGIAVWSHALRLAGWPDDREVWTGSCPCQPFSAAGKGKGFDDERHLWPAWFKLIQECRPPIIFGEQVASADVVGKSARQALPSVQERETIFGFLRELKGVSAKGLQELRAGSRAQSEARQSRPDEAKTEGVAGRLSGTRLGECCPSSSEDTKSAVRSGPGEHPEKDHGGSLRNDGNTVRSHDAASMECTLSRSDTAGRRLHGEQYQSSSLCPECDGEHLGATEDCGDCVGDLTETLGEIERLIAADSRETESPDGAPWLDVVQAHLVGAGYSVGACVVPACGIGGPHIRQRLWFVGERLDDATGSRHLGPLSGAEGETRDETRLRLPGEGGRSGGLGHDDDARLEGQRHGHQAEGGWNGAAGSVAEAGEPRGLADADEGQRGRIANGEGRQRDGTQAGWQQGDGESQPGGVDGRLADDDDAGREQLGAARLHDHGQPGHDVAGRGEDGRPSPTNGHWRDADWLFCRDGRWRPVEPSTFPLVDGAAFKLGSGSALEGKSRVGMLRAYGNAIVASVAAEFIQAVMEARP